MENRTTKANLEEENIIGKRDQYSETNKPSDCEQFQKLYYLNQIFSLKGIEGFVIVKGVSW